MSPSPREPCDGSTCTLSSCQTAPVSVCRLSALRKSTVPPVSSETDEMRCVKREPTTWLPSRSTSCPAANRSIRADICAAVSPARGAGQLSASSRARCGTSARQASRIRRAPLPMRNTSSADVGASSSSPPAANLARASIDGWDSRTSADGRFPKTSEIVWLSAAASTETRPSASSGASGSTPDQPRDRSKCCCAARSLDRSASIEHKLWTCSAPGFFFLTVAGRAGA